MSENLTIADALIEKEGIEHKITSMIQHFNDQFDVEISDINLQRTQVISYGGQNMCNSYKVELEVKL